ncbi:hypothetical protein VTK73DRAFT_5628 [Phialemonium thermophilum]|uniref:Uncharacterized protein n=1 Tax=Phialemonium thermophilum TaxID=223376 RepID=A0ABR3V1I3_9PEZI
MRWVCGPRSVSCEITWLVEAACLRRRDGRSPGSSCSSGKASFLADGLGSRPGPTHGRRPSPAGLCRASVGRRCIPRQAGYPRPVCRTRLSIAERHGQGGTWGRASVSTMISSRRQQTTSWEVIAFSHIQPIPSSPSLFFGPQVFGGPAQQQAGCSAPLSLKHGTIDRPDSPSYCRLWLFGASHTACHSLGGRAPLFASCFCGQSKANPSTAPPSEFSPRRNT